MNHIKLKSNMHKCVHDLYELIPLEERHPDEKVFKFKSEYPTDLIYDENRDTIGICFTFGPILYVGQINPQMGMPLKEIVPAYDSNGEFIYTALIFKYDISSNEETGTV